MIVGYARVSTDGQTLDAQQSALTAAGAEKTFSDKVSGAVTDRKALARAIATLGPGDVLLDHRLCIFRRRGQKRGSQDFDWSSLGVFRSWGSIRSSTGDVNSSLNASRARAVAI